MWQRLNAEGPHIDAHLETQLDTEEELSIYMGAYEVVSSTGRTRQDSP